MNYKVFIVMAMLSFSFVCHAASMSPESHAMAEPRWLSSQEFKSLSKRNQYKECYAFACNPVNFLGSRLTCLNFILDNLLAKTKIELFNVYLVLAKNPNQKRDFYGNKAFDLAQEMNDAYCICESYIPISLRPGLTQPDIVLKAVSYIYGYFNELGQWNVGHGDYWQKYRILMAALNVNWVKVLGEQEKGEERSHYFIKELIACIEDPQNDIFLINKYEAYVRALWFFNNPDKFEHMRKAYICAIQLKCVDKKEKIERWAKRNRLALPSDVTLLPSSELRFYPISGPMPVRDTGELEQDIKQEPIPMLIPASRPWTHKPYSFNCLVLVPEPQENE